MYRERNKGANVPQQINHKVLVEPESIADRVKVLGRQITEDYEGKDLVILGILRGAFVFVADLAREIDLKFEVDFLAISSYEGKESTGKFVVQSDLRAQIKGRDVLIVEDIVDSGNTVSFLMNHLAPHKPNSIKVCSLLAKSESYTKNPQVDYLGFDIPSAFVVGYGLDLDGYFRNLPYIAHVID